VCRRRAVRSLAWLLLVIGVWQLGRGGYLEAKAWLSQVLLSSAWSQTLSGHGHTRPWPWADTWPVARLRAPKQDTDLVVLAGASGRTLAFGPGHLDGTAAPGEPGNSVISGHRDTHFRFLKHVHVGDPLQVERPDGHWRDYKVVNMKVMDARHARLVTGTDEALLTLVTCYPFDAVVPGGPLRYVVLAQAVD
jgi:sortase A